MKFDFSNEIKVEDNIFMAWGNNADAYVWYNTAQENLYTAKILQENHRYAHAVFFLQQCVECLVKGIFLETGLVLQPKDISHKPEKVFIRLYEKVGDMVHKENCEKINKALNDRKIVKFEDKITYFIGVVNDATSQYEKLKFSYPIIAEYSYVQNVLFCFSKLFEETQQNTRYPMNGEKIMLPSEVYKNPIIEQKMPSLISILEYIVSIILKHNKV